MGVQGLTTYVEGNRHFFQDVKFRDSRLVIDGCSLYFRLYFTHYLDQQHGGDYDAFAGLLIQFLSALAACDIQPYVVLDGGNNALKLPCPISSYTYTFFPNKLELQFVILMFQAETTPACSLTHNFSLCF